MIDANPVPRARIGLSLERRLATLREARLADAVATGTLPAIPAPPPRHRSGELARRLAEALDGERVDTPVGSYVRVERPSVPLPVDRDALATIPALPGPAARFVCLDTETTGLATASGTVAFLVGLGWWEADRFRQVQLLLPDHSDEPALLAALRELLPADPWLVTYNGRAFDWPLLVARFRMGRDRPPALAGHLDLLPFVRRTFRHRMEDARLRTVERELLGLRRVGDVDGWEIPGRYLGFLRGGDAAPLIDVVRHNDEDVRSLGRLVGHVADYLGRPACWRDGHPGDLAALAAAYRRAKRDEEALAALEAALAVHDELLPAGAGTPPARATTLPALPARHDLAADRARLLSRLRRHADAVAAWESLLGVGAGAAATWIEIAKLREHRLRDPDGALAATEAAARLVERSRALGQPTGTLERDLGRRRARLRARLERQARATTRATRTPRTPRTPPVTRP